MISMIVAHAQNRVIGNNNEIPWYIRDDILFFKEATMDKIVIMGRKTYESIPERHRPLMGRTTYLITRNPSYEVIHPSVKIFTDFDKAIFSAKLTSPDQEIMIAGGAQIYKLALQYADRVYATVLTRDFIGDSFFPILPSDEWHVIDNPEIFVDEQLQLQYRRYIYQRKKGAMRPSV